MIETWFDDPYKEYFYTREPLARYVDMGDISEQLQLRKDLQCKSFDWFMKEIAYDIFEKYPPLPPNHMWGEMRNLANDFCLDTHGRHPPEKVNSTCTILYTHLSYFFFVWLCKDLIAKDHTRTQTHRRIFYNVTE